jgi:hypothetical protein
MRGSALAAVALALQLSASATATAAGAEPLPPQSLVFMTAQEWRKSSAPQRQTLAADFMRVFCVQPAMSPAKLSACLDGELRDGPAFDPAIQCLRRLSTIDY